MYMNLKNIIYVKHSEAHTQPSHLMRLDERKFMMMSLKKICINRTSRVFLKHFLYRKNLYCLIFAIIIICKSKVIIKHKDSKEI